MTAQTTRLSQSKFGKHSLDLMFCLARMDEMILKGRIPSKNVHIKVQL